MGTIAEDATQYFLVIFTSHFVLEMTLNLARVSTTVSPKNHGQQCSTQLFRNRSNYFQLRKSFLIYTMYNHSHYAFRRCYQRKRRVGATFRLCFLAQMTNGRYQVPSCDDFADNALIEESRGRIRGRLVPWGDNCEQHRFSDHEVLPPQEYHQLGNK